MTIGDVHGDSATLEAVLRDVDRVGADLVVHFGDHFSSPLKTVGTTDLVAGRDMLRIRGHDDRWLIQRAWEEMDPSDRVTDTQLIERRWRWPSFSDT